MQTYHSTKEWVLISLSMTDSTHLGLCTDLLVNSTCFGEGYLAKDKYVGFCLLLGLLSTGLPPNLDLCHFLCTRTAHHCGLVSYDCVSFIFLLALWSMLACMRLPTTPLSF